MSAFGGGSSVSRAYGVDHDASSELARLARGRYEGVVEDVLMSCAGRGRVGNSVCGAWEQSFDFNVR